jgi:hypothetical protein
MEATRGKEAPVGDADIERKLQGADRFGPSLLKPEGGGILLTLQVKGFSLGDLAKMDFHGDTLAQDSQGWKGW